MIGKLPQTKLGRLFLVFFNLDIDANKNKTGKNDI
jgi:hypothetical protein